VERVEEEAAEGGRVRGLVAQHLLGQRLEQLAEAGGHGEPTLHQFADYVAAIEPVNNAQHKRGCKAAKSPDRR